MTEPAAVDESAKNVATRKLMLVDGHALVHRAFHALPELTTTSGELVNAVFGWTSMVIKAIDTLRPTHAIVAFDRPSPTFRHQEYAEYKATRARTPRPLSMQFERVREVATAFNMPIVELSGFEADDILGTLAAQAEREGVPTVIVTGDLDTLQLVDDYITVLTNGRLFNDTKLYDVRGVMERFGLSPVQVPDLKGLIGDSSDNIPGIRGIGEKTAAKLLQQYGSIDGIYEHLEEIKGNVGNLLRDAREQSFKSRYLARIVTNAPVDLDLEASAIRDFDMPQLISLFRDLEFRSLIPRVQQLHPTETVAAMTRLSTGGEQAQMSLFTEETKAESAGETEQTPEGLAPQIDLEIVRESSQLSALVERLRQASEWSFDVEAMGSNAFDARLVGIAFSLGDRTASYIPVGHVEGDQLSLDTVVEALRPLFEDPTQRKVGHNLKYGVLVLANYGITVRGLYCDTMLAGYLENSSSRMIALDSLAAQRLGIEIMSLESLVGKGKKQISCAEVEVEQLGMYAGVVAAVSLRLAPMLRERLQHRNLESLFDEVEMPLLGVLAEMERNGVALDIEFLRAMSVEITQTLGDIEARIYERVGHPFNINSPPQLGDVLFNELKLPKRRKTKTGYSTDNEVLEKLRDEFPIVDDVLEFRQLMKLKGTYIDALPALLSPRDGKVHTDFNQAVAATGRLSSSNPNLQNIPIRSEIGHQIRQAFTPSQPGSVILAADYSQIELRVLAHLSRDEKLMDAFLHDQDIHVVSAAAVWGIEPKDVTSDQRRIAKVVNFGIVYGIGDQRLAYETGLTREEAATFIAAYRQTYSGVTEFMDGIRSQAQLYGQVSTLLNRVRSLPEIHSNHPGVRQAAERAAINMPVQGTAADIIKIAMIRVARAMTELGVKSRMILQVHDELVFEVPQEEVEAMALLVRDGMMHALDLAVPLGVEVNVGPNWGSMQRYHLDS
jgi:DNA polymerase-1